MPGLLHFGNGVIVGWLVPDVETVAPCAAKLVVALAELLASLLAVHDQMQQVGGWDGVAHHFGLPR